MKSDTESTDDANTSIYSDKSERLPAPSGSMKEAFLDWLESDSPKKCSPALAEDCFDRTSEYSIRKKISQVPLWNVTDFPVFKSTYNRLINDKFFRIYDKSNYKLFLLIGKLYSTFLEQKSLSHKIKLDNNLSRENPSVKDDSHKNLNTVLPTIKEACMSALQSTVDGMTIQQIHKKILEKDFYNFRALNPESVIQAEIERACENSGCAPTLSSKKTFRFERNQNGERVYFLSSVIPLNCIAKDPNGKTRSSEPENEIPGPSKIEIWNKSIESDFRAWMKTQNYASSTRNVYSGTMKQIAQHFLKLSDTAVCKSTTMKEAACTFIKLLRQDPEFAAISAKKSQFSSSLAAFERFVGSQSSDFSSEANHTMSAKTDNRYESGKTDSGSSKIEIWNKSIERDFLTWMRKKNYASSNRKFNRFYVEMIMDDFNTLADQATRESKTMPEAARKFTFLLRRSREFEAKASVSHKFGAALAVYAEFVDSGDYVLSSDSPDSKETKTNKRHESKVNEGLKSKVTDILFKNFKNGFRLDSLIEVIRFRHFYADASGEDIDLSDEELKRVISACGYLFKGKVYIVSAEIKSKIKRNVDETFESGARMVFYEVFYEKNEDWLFPGRIVSVEMLEDIFRRLFRSSSGYIHKKNYISKRSFTRDELTMIKTEILRVWEKDVLVSYSQLAERLPYIPFEKIRYALAYNSDFVRNSDGVYTHISKVDITGEERSRIANFVAERCVANGYASMNDIPLDEIEERNHELTTTAIQNAAFQISLSDKYDKKGRIVTHKGGTLNALTIMKDYCRKLDKCSLDDLLSFQEELVGQRENQSTAMEAAYAILVRVEKNIFLAEKYVDFNTSEIDNAIALFVKGDYLPLKSFTTFVAFPHCGQPWNLFLLESYCRRFSKRFRFDTPSVNSRNAGAVIRRGCRLTYLEIMADAVVRSNIPYEEKTIGKFLYEKGYTGKSTAAKASEIIERAKVIRERKG